MARVTISLLDLDGRIPNLALMKLSAFWKAQGAEVVLNFPLFPADYVYASKVFSWSLAQLPPARKRLVIGGSGTRRWHVKLPEEIEHQCPDYELYGINYSIGFTTRGCNRRCPWCIVPQKEGPIALASPLSEFVRHERVMLLDNNLLQHPDADEILKELINRKLLGDFNQGLDARLIPYHIELLARIRRWRPLRFAFDTPEMAGAVIASLKSMKAAGLPRGAACVYVLLGFSTREEELSRFRLLADWGVEVFPMRYRGPDGKEACPRGKRLNPTEVYDLFGKLRGPRDSMQKLRRWFCEDEGFAD